MNRMLRSFRQRNAGLRRWSAVTTLWLVVFLFSMLRPAGADDPARVNGRVAADASTRPAADARATSFAKIVRPFLRTWCCKCHGSEQQKGERRFDNSTGAIESDGDLVDLQDILDQLNLGEMPPSDADQPPDEERRVVTRVLTERIAAHHAATGAKTGRTVLRRLNAREYRNTVRDLLQIELTMFDPAQGFPRDQRSEHLDNNGEALVTSGYLLRQYLMAAEKVVHKALTPLTKPDVRTWTFDENFQQQPEIDQVHRKTNEFRHMTLYEVRGADKHEGAYGSIRDFVKGVPEDGIYEIRFEAEALNRVHQYDDEFLRLDKSEPFRLGIVPGDHTVGALHHTQPIEPLLTEVDIADGRQWYTVQVWLDAGKTPRFTFENGMMDVRSLWSRVFRQYPKLLPKPRRKGIVEARYLAIKDGKFPQIRIHRIEIRGPIYEQWPTPGHRAILGDDWEAVVRADELPDALLRKHLTSFLLRAYRRPAQPEEIGRVMGIIRDRHAAGRSPIDAYGDGLKAALCSPSFLYLDESTAAKVVDDDGAGTVEQAERRLDSYALASRLSYFLWSSMPDRELLELAESGQLQRSEVLAQQVDRLLRDPRSRAFVEGFLGSWLTLQDLGSTPPDRSTFPDYYQYDLDTAMREETRLFTRHLVDQNMSIDNFLDSDFTFVNRALARHYALDEPSGRGFHKVSLTDRRRGGLLGHASVLTVTANGIDTSPVVRGVWLLENILGTPPAPPPPDVEPLDPDIRGAKTIREQLEKHRSVSACNDCHRSIDPPGFALENFDPVGAWRTSYGRKTRIDASGEFPDGQRFSGIKDFKKILLTREDQFARALTTKLLAYATGRDITAADRPEVDAILATSKKQGRGFRSLISLVAASEIFRSN